MTEYYPGKGVKFFLGKIRVYRSLKNVTKFDKVHTNYCKKYLCSNNYTCTSYSVVLSIISVIYNVIQLQSSFIPKVISFLSCMKVTQHFRFNKKRQHTSSSHVYIKLRPCFTPNHSVCRLFVANEGKAHPFENLSTSSYFVLYLFKAWTTVTHTYTWF